VVALRKRSSPSASEPHPSETVVERGDGVTSPSAAAHAPDNQPDSDSAMMPKAGVDESRPASAPDPSPRGEDGLRQRLAELQRAELAAQQLHAEQAERIQRQFRGDPAQPQSPQQAALEQAKKDVSEWLAVRPGIISDPQAIATSTKLVSEGYLLASPAWRREMEARGFSSRDYSQPAQPAKPVEQGPLATEEQYEQPKSEEPPMDEPEHRAESRYLSAPVSREGGVSLSGERSLSPNSFRLSPDERLIAKGSGISEVEYARQKIKLEQMKRQGSIKMETSDPYERMRWRVEALVMAGLESNPYYFSDIAPALSAARIVSLYGRGAAGLLPVSLMVH
jgi:hypothetical protein